MCGLCWKHSAGTKGAIRRRVVLGNMFMQPDRKRKNWLPVPSHEHNREIVLKIGEALAAPGDGHPTPLTLSLLSS